MDREPLFVTRPFLPPLSEFLPLLEQIWQSRILTNCGPFHRQLEEALAALFDGSPVRLVVNGTIALEAAVESAGLSGEVVTTPYSFVATTHALRRKGLEPVFVDVLERDLNIDPDRIVAAITPRTTAIVAVHCYGNPCGVEKIEAIAQDCGVKVIYDAAHAFGVRHRGRSLLSYGDFATLSFHATKVFNTFEGGAVVASDEGGAEAVERLRNFGIVDEVTISSLGTNAKMHELSAAMGLLQLRHFEEVRSRREAIDRRYRERLKEVEGIDPLPIPAETEPNYSYFPILVGPGSTIGRDALHEALRGEGIHTRRYFHPLLSNLPMYRDLPSAARDRLPIANRAAQQVLCLPIYPELSADEQDRIVEAIIAAARK